MDKKEVIDFVSKLLKFANDVPAPADTKPADKAAPADKANTPMIEVKTKDGLILTTSAPKWDKDVEVMLKNEDGTTKPADDNVYELEDGSKITVKGGKVTDITAVAETPADEINEDVKMSSESFSKELKIRDDKFSKLEEKFNKMVEATLMLTEAFNKLPISDKIVFTPTVTSTEEDFGRPAMSKKEKNIKQMASVLEEIRNEYKKK